MQAKPSARRGCLPSLLCLTTLSSLLLVHNGCCSAEPVGEAPALQQLDLDQLLQVMTMGLHSEMLRGNESLLSFFDFRELEQTDCMQRLVYMMNETMVLRDHMQRYHSEISGSMQAFTELMRRLPDSDENTWIWLLITSHERLMNKLRTYWSMLIMLALDRHHCFVADIRNVMLDAIVVWKGLHNEFVELLWHDYAYGTYMGATPVAGGGAGGAPGALAEGGVGGPPAEVAARSIADGLAWSSKVLVWFDGYATKLLEEMLKADESGAVQDVAGQRLYHQDDQGSFVMYEFLRRKVFGQWAIDKGLLRGLIRNVWKPPLDDGPDGPLAIGDFGAGGGHYSRWLNETGLVNSFAFDGTAGANALTDGTVQEINLVADTTLWRTFDWVFCLEVGEHIPKQYTGTLMGNLKRHAREGLVMSWSEDWEGIGHVNCLPRADFIAMVQKETGFVFDEEATEEVRKTCEIDYIARSLAIFRAPKTVAKTAPEPKIAAPKPAAAPASSSWFR